MREENVIKRCQSGDESAFEELISFYYPHVSGFLSNMACRRDMIEDIVQETFIKMIRGIDRFDLRGNAKFSTYLFTIARNCYIDAIRREKQTGFNIDELENLLTAPESTEELILHRMEFEDLEAELDRLPPVQQTAVRLKYFEGLSLKEIGAVTGVEEKTVKSRIHRGITTMRRKMSKGGAQHVL